MILMGIKWKHWKEFDQNYTINLQKVKKDLGKGLPA